MVAVTREDILRHCAPIAACIEQLGTVAPERLVAALEALDTSALEATLLAAHAAGWLTPKEAGGVKFGRVSRADAATHGLSIDAVDMNGPAAGAHTHPKGEVELCIDLAGEPRFDGLRQRFIAYPPGSRHVPTVSEGRMLILYFLPGGEIVFE
jgi:hypothetical protein